MNLKEWFNEYNAMLTLLREWGSAPYEGDRFIDTTTICRYIIASVFYQMKCQDIPCGKFQEMCCSLLISESCEGIDDDEEYECECVKTVHGIISNAASTYCVKEKFFIRRTVVNHHTVYHNYKTDEETVLYLEKQKTKIEAIKSRIESSKTAREAFLEQKRQEQEEEEIQQKQKEVLKQFRLRFSTLVDTKLMDMDEKQWADNPLLLLLAGIYDKLNLLNYTLYKQRNRRS